MDEEHRSFASVKRSVILSDLAQIQNYIFGMTAVIVLLAFLAAIYITRIVYKPIRKLLLAMKKVSDGDLDTRVEVISKDEIGMAAEEFNRMLNQIKALIQQLLHQEQEKKDAELEALQYQITPHFMYNTLFSQNFWWFLAAAAVNAAFQITNTSWNCLFIEDCPPKHITNAFTLIQMCGMLSVFFSPLAVILVGKHDVVPVMRWLYLIAAISMLAKFLLLYHFGGETQIGKKRMEETRNLSYFSMMKGYGRVFLTMIKSGKMRLVVYFMALTNIIQIATTNFFSLYVTEQIHLSDELVAVFPVIRTIVMIAFVIGLQNLFQKLRMKASLQIGFLMYIASHLLLLLTPEKNLLLVMGYTILEAAAYAVIIPRKDALMAHYVEPKERSRIYALYNVLMIGISAPFGSLVGWMFDLHPALPFLFNIGIFVLCIFLTMASRDLSHLEESIS